MLNPDYRDMLSALSAEGAEFLVVGAFALAAHGLPRATGDIDIWIRRSDENAERVWRALTRFKASMHNLTVDDLKTVDTVFQIGVAPRRIDVLTSIDGLDFEEAWPRRKDVDVAGQHFAVVGWDDLLRNKKASARPKDRADAVWLESGLEQG
jgi:hypothetical protein